MSWGFSCGNGWFDLIDRLSSKIEAECERLKVEEGWRDDQLPIATQVKEKLGSLRFHLRTQASHGFKMDEKLRTLIETASVESETICELCGSPGTRRTEDVGVVFCDACYREKKASALG